MQNMRAVYINLLPSAEPATQADNFLRAAQSACVSRVVKHSGMNGNEDSKFGMIRAHADAGKRITAAGLDYAILRANSFYQNILAQMGTIKSTGQFYLPLKDTHQSLVDVEDVANAAIKALTFEQSGSGVYDISGPQSLTFHDVAASLSKACKVRDCPKSLRQMWLSCLKSSLTAPMPMLVVTLRSCLVGRLEL